MYILSIYESSKSGYEPFLHASKIISNSGSQEKETLHLENKNSRKESNNQKICYNEREINISTEKKSSFQINIFCKYLDEIGGAMQIGDMFWLNYSEQDLSLIGKADENSGKRGGDCGFAICETTDRNKKFIGNSNGLFKVEGYRDDSKGGLVTWNGRYRIKHLA